MSFPAVLCTYTVCSPETPHVCFDCNQQTEHTEQAARGYAKPPCQPTRQTNKQFSPLRELSLVLGGLYFILRSLCHNPPFRSRLRTGLLVSLIKPGGQAKLEIHSGPRVAGINKLNKLPDREYISTVWCPFSVSVHTCAAKASNAHYVKPAPLIPLYQIRITSRLGCGKAKLSISLTKLYAFVE